MAAELDNDLPTPRRPGRRVRAWHWVAGVLVLLMLMLGGVAYWAGTPGSLPRALQLAQKYLPGDQTLVYEGAEGSLAGGGRIARLQWSKPGTEVVVEDLQLDWILRQLLGRALHVRTLSAANVHVRLTPQPEKPEEPPFEMPADVSLPIRLTVPLDIARLQIDSVAEDGTVTTQLIESIVARYRFDGEQHLLRLESLRYGQSTLEAEGQLHAETLALSAQLVASLRDLAPDTPFAMLARLEAEGTLAGGDAAAVTVRLDAQQQNQGAPDDSGAQIDAQAVIHPWREQPAQQVNVQVSRLNARAFHAAAPTTGFRGNATLQPVAGQATAAWDIVVDFVNEQAGAFDNEQLPLRALNATARLTPELLDITTAVAELAGAAPAGTVTLKGQLPLQQMTQARLQLALQRIDLQPLMSSLPRTAFEGNANVAPLDEGWQARADIRNTLPGPLDRERAPLDRLLADLHFLPAEWRIETLQMQVGSGQVELLGSYLPEGRVVDLRGELQRLPLRQIHGKLATGLATRLSGTVVLSGDMQQGVAFNTDITSDAPGAAGQRAEWEIRAVQARGNWSPTRLIVERIHVDAFQASVDGSDIDVVLPGLDSIQARIRAVAPGMTLEADAAMLQQTGEGKLSLQLASAGQLVEWLKELPMMGALPALRAEGAASLQAEWQGGWRQWADGLRNPAAYPRLRVDANARTEGLRIDLPRGEDQPPTRIDVQNLVLDIQGNLAAATLVLDGEGTFNGTQALADIRMQMTQRAGAGGAPRWNFAVQQFTASATLPDQTAPWQLSVADGLQVTAQTGSTFELRATAGTATLTAPPNIAAGGDATLEVAWQPLLWRRNAQGGSTLQSTGAITGIQPAWLDVLLATEGEGPLTAAGLRTDLVLSGDWDIQMTDNVNIRAQLRRDSGDLWLTDADNAAGIRTLELQLQSAGDDVSLALDWDTERAGVITAKVGTQLSREGGGWSLPDDAPVNGNVKASLTDLGAWAFLAPPGWRVQGAMNADIRLGGTIAAPQLNGGIEGSGLNIRSVLDGVDLHDGTLRATLSGSRLEINALTLQGGTGSSAYVRGMSGNRTQPPTARGSMTATGSIDWSGVANAGPQDSGISMDLRAELSRMQVLVRNDRQMTLSGELSAGLAQGALQVRGDITVDRASIVLPEASAPTLGDDVVVVRNSDIADAATREARGRLETARPMDMEIKLDLGRDLALEGQGITTRLEGELTVRSGVNGSDTFSVYGEVRTVEGRYRAWGQALDVETGVVMFNGPYDNPSLNLLAIRPEIDVRAGVRVTGTLRAPRAQLYSEPNLPEAEKLSWVVLGRATATAGAEGTSMQQAALGLLAGSLSGGLASGLGLDELGLGDSSVSIGKRISNELYLTYEAGLSGAASTLFIFYDITRRFTVRGQTGEASAVDLIYTISYD